MTPEEKMKFSHLEGVRSLAIVGATGLVGGEFLSILTEHKIKIGDLRLLASSDSVGELLEVNGTEVRVEEITPDALDVEAAFFCVPNEITKKYVPIAVKHGALVFDDSSVFRMEKEVPLVVPEVNGHLLREFQGNIISTPNCTTTPLVLALKPLHEQFGLERVVVSTYQSVSGAGKEASNELSVQTAALLNGAEAEMSVFPHRIAFNCLPWIGTAAENGNSEEEEKVIRETRKILALPELRVSATAVRVPTFFGHGLSVNVQLKKNYDSVDLVRELLDASEGLKVMDLPLTHIYPTNVECSGADPAFVGRIRRDNSVPSGVNFWIMADNLRKGAALNVLQTLDTLYRYRRMS
jgi:aspartate-semialdehyde dehydrogenase